MSDRRVTHATAEVPGVDNLLTVASVMQITRDGPGSVPQLLIASRAGPASALPVSASP